jgi:hypothetical protein
MRRTRSARKVRVLCERMPENLLPKRVALPIPEIEYRPNHFEYQAAEINYSATLDDDRADTCDDTYEMWEDLWLLEET